MQPRRDFRSIPSIEELRQRAGARALEAEFGRAATVDALRSGAAAARDALRAGDPALTDADAVARRIEAHAASTLRSQFRPSLGPVVNATGVIVHTNLGRAPLAAAAVARVDAIARGYSTLEYDLERGERGRRDVHAEALLRMLTGAEAAVVVNNNAAATMLMLAALAYGREVIVSRGELVEIGGGFRVPDVMAQSGALLREVGTTNKTRAADYAAAITDRTALLLRVHPSNFRIEGFTERPDLREMVAVGREFNVPVAEDLGSGYLGTAGSATIPDEPRVTDSVAAGVDVCSFSGDKLLGGPQAGIIVGRADLVSRIRSHPLMRALRTDKMTYAALEATLAEYAAGRAHATIPVQRMLALSADDIRARAEKLRARVDASEDWTAELMAGTSAVGGGSAPGIELPTWLVSIARRGFTPQHLEQQLRTLSPPIITRIEHDRVLIDLRTVSPEDDLPLADALADL